MSLPSSPQAGRSIRSPTPASCPDLSTVVYDRSLYQERAPGIARENIRFLTWYSVLVGASSTWPGPATRRSPSRGGTSRGCWSKPSPPRRDPGEGPRDARARIAVRVRRRSGSATTTAYVAMNHDELYLRFAEVWPGGALFDQHRSLHPISQPTPPTGGVRLADGVKRPVLINERTSGHTLREPEVELVVIHCDVQAVVVALPEGAALELIRALASRGLRESPDERGRLCFDQQPDVLYAGSVSGA